MTSTKKVYIEVALEAYEKLEAELEHATKEFERNNAFTHKRLTELQTENQQLKDQVECLQNINNYAKGVVCYDCERCRVPQLEKQIADANQILNEYCEGCSKFGINECMLKAPQSCIFKRMRIKIQLLKEEKTP